MKILFISESYYPHLSGVPVVVQYLAEGLAKRHQISVATSISNNDKLSYEDEVNGVKIYRFLIFRDIFKRLRGDLQGLQKFVLNFDSDVIVIECAQASTTDVLLPVLKKINVPCILHAHGLSGLLGKPFVIKSDIKHTIGNTYNWIRMQFYYGYTFKRCCSNFAASISLSENDSGYSYLSKYILKNYVLGNAAEDIFFEKTSECYELPIKGLPYLISIANYSVVKNQIAMMREFYESNIKDYALVMIGSRNTSYYYRLLQEKLKLDKRYGFRNVIALLGIDRKYFPTILDGASGYLVSSIYEEFSISIIEAMARSVPFISTNVGNANELPGGIVVYDIHDMHKAIEELLVDQNRRNYLGKKAKTFAYKNCRREDAVNKMEAILEEILKSR